MASSSSFIFTLARAEGVAQVLQHEQSLHAKISRAFTLATGDWRLATFLTPRRTTKRRA
jgi:hypothetical protein